METAHFMILISFALLLISQFLRSRMNSSETASFLSVFSLIFLLIPLLNLYGSFGFSVLAIVMISLPLYSLSLYTLTGVIDGILLFFSISLMSVFKVFGFIGAMEPGNMFKAFLTFIGVFFALLIISLLMGVLLGLFLSDKKHAFINSMCYASYMVLVLLLIVK